MPSAPLSELILTPTISTKTAVVYGAVAVGETVAVTVKGMASYIAAGALRIRIRHNGTDIARYPAETGDVWTASGTGLVDASCVLSLNTVQAFAPLVGRGDMARLPCTLLVELGDPKTLTIKGYVELMNWPQVEGADAPYDLGTWPDDLAEAQEAIADQVAAFDLHDHAAGSPTQVSHLNLTDKGTMTHAVIDSTLAALGNSVTVAEGLITVLQNDVNDAEAALASHNHNGSGSQKLSHAGLDGIGTRTHAELESDTAAAVATATARKALYDAHAHTGADGTPKVAVASLDGWAAILARLEAAEAALIVANQTIAALDAAAVKKTASAYTVDAGLLGTNRFISVDSTADQIAAFLPTLIADLQNKGVI